MSEICADGAGVSGGDDATGTPVTSLRDLLSGRLLNLLQREGFHTVEQVAAASDDALLAVRRMGWPSVLEIRTAVAETHAAGRQGWDEVTFDSAHVRELISLLTILVAYADGREQRDVADRARVLLAVVTR